MFLSVYCVTILVNFLAPSSRRAVRDFQIRHRAQPQGVERDATVVTVDNDISGRALTPVSVSIVIEDRGELLDLGWSAPGMTRAPPASSSILSEPLS